MTLYADDPDVNISFPLKESEVGQPLTFSPVVKVDGYNNVTASWIGDPGETRTLKVPLAGLPAHKTLKLRLVVPNDNDIDLGRAIMQSHGLGAGVLEPTVAELLDARITALEAGAGGGGGGSQGSLIVVDGGTVDLDDTKTDGYLIGYRVTATTTIEGVTFEPGSFIFERDSSVYGGWTYRIVAAGSGVVTPPDTTAPTAPTLSVNNSSSTQLVATFSGGTDAVGVTQYRSRINAGAWTVGASPRTFTGLTASTSYTIDVQAGDAADNWSTSATWTGSTAAHVPTYAEVVNVDGPTHFWPLDGDGTDTAGSNALTLSGGATYGAAAGDGSGGLVLATGTDKATGTGVSLTAATAFTFECIIKLTGTQANGNNWKVLADGAAASLGIYTHTDGTARFASANVGIILGPAGNPAWASGRHVHIAMTWDGTNVRCYVNGVAGTAVAKSSGWTGTGAFQLGGDGFVGTIDGAAFYMNKALNGARLLAHAQAAGLA